MDTESEVTNPAQAQPPMNNTETESHGGSTAAYRPIGRSRELRARAQMKRKRGRPTKYHPGRTTVFEVTPISMAPPGPSIENGRRPSPPSSTTSTASAEAGQNGMDAMGSSGTGMIPHIITIEAGEDVATKITSTFPNGSRSFCILSATGTISSVTLRRAATCGPVTYEGPFEILSLSGLYMPSETAGPKNWNGALSVSLAANDGWVLGGKVAGLFRAASPVKVIVGSFIAAVEEPKQSNPSVLASAPRMFVPGGTAGAHGPSPGIPTDM